MAKKAGTAIEVEPGRLVHPETISQLEQAACQAIAEHHAQKPLEPGIAREELRTRLFGTGPRLYQRVLENLAGRGRIVVERDTVRLPTHRPREEGRGSELADKVSRLLETGGLQPPRVKELAQAIGANERDALAALKMLQTASRVVRVTDELYFDAGALGALRQRLSEVLQRSGSITAQGFKELTGASRKFSIPLAEHFDAEKLTMRVGETRVLRRKG